MFNRELLKKVLAQYKKDFVSTQWSNEKFKWEAVKWFQDNWDVNASDFHEMLTRSLDKTSNLLASKNNFPKIKLLNTNYVNVITPESLKGGQMENSSWSSNFIEAVNKLNK